MILILDNYDSFVYNLARYVEELGYPRKVVRNDKITLEEIEQLSPSHIIISPGPCSPLEAGLSNVVIETYGSRIPILGVCLGHQCIGHVFGGQVKRAKKPLHGKVSRIKHIGKGVFQNLPQPLSVTRYHSLIVENEQLPHCLEVTAISEEGEIMGLAHRQYPIVGVQFHPEAVLTEKGYDLIHNFLEGRYR